MADNEVSPNQEPAHEPDFELPRYRVIREDNWPEYQARGFQPVKNATQAEAVRALSSAEFHYGGDEHVSAGDAWDEAEERPLHHKPGIGIYADPQGLAIGEENDRHMQERIRLHGY